MAIKPQSIRSGVVIKFDNKIVDKQTVIAASETWSLNHETLFRKLLKQGGSFPIKGVQVEVTTVEKVVNSQGQPEVTVPKIDPLARF
jgi:hypothetical protein